MQPTKTMRPNLPEEDAQIAFFRPKKAQNSPCYLLKK